MNLESPAVDPLPTPITTPDDKGLENLVLNPTRVDSTLNTPVIIPRDTNTVRRFNKERDYLNKQTVNVNCINSGSPLFKFIHLYLSLNI